MPTRDATERFVQQLIACQTRVYTYVLSLLADPELADEVVAETNLILWRKLDEFDTDAPGSDFGAWACTIARYQVLAARQKLARDRIVFDDDVLATIADRAAERTVDTDHRRRALRHCLRTLPREQQNLIQTRYAVGGSVKQIAERLGRPAASISQSIYRIRAALLACIERRLTGDAADLPIAGGDE